MNDVSLFDFAARRSEWLARREVAITQNIANVSRPGYKAVDAPAFAQETDAGAFHLAVTDRAHLAIPAEDAPRLRAVKTATWETAGSGNSVVLEEELVKANDVSRAMSLNTSIVHAFQKILMANVKA